MDHSLLNYHSKKDQANTWRKLETSTVQPQEDLVEQAGWTWLLSVKAIESMDILA